MTAYHKSPAILYSELLAIISAISYIQSSTNRRESIIQIESDSLEAIQAINGMNTHAPIETQSLLEEIRHLKMGKTTYSVTSKEKEMTCSLQDMLRLKFRVQQVWNVNWPDFCLGM